MIRAVGALTRPRGSTGVTPPAGRAQEVGLGPADRYDQPHEPCRRQSLSMSDPVQRLIAGFLAGAVVRGRRFGFITSVIVGLIGALIGGFLFAVLHIGVPAFLQGELTIRVIDIFVAFVGAVILLLILGLFYRYRRPI